MVDLDTIVSLCKRRGFIFQSSEIYGGVNGAWDYGPVGVELKRNIREAWWRDTVGSESTRSQLGADPKVTGRPESDTCSPRSGPLTTRKVPPGRWRVKAGTSSSTLVTFVCRERVMAGGSVQ